MLTISIPTYWSRPLGEPARPGDAVFFHPIPLGGGSPLPRLLESLARLGSHTPFRVLALTAAVAPELQAAAQAQVAQLLAPFAGSFPVAQFHADDLPMLHRAAGDVGLDAAAFTLATYPGIRNCQLLAAHALGSETLIALDEDEIVRPNYLDCAGAFIGAEYQGARVVGVTGFYIHSDGSCLWPQEVLTGNLFLDKAVTLNTGILTLEAQTGQLVEAPFAYGGNMILHQDLFTRVSFDPWIPLGEDVDYVINARMAGLRFWFDKRLEVTHLPPVTPQPWPYEQLAQDVTRFIYEREKVRAAKIDPATLAPYPGRFLRDDIDEAALAALAALAAAAEAERAGAPGEILARAQQHAREGVTRYRAFAARWPALCTRIVESGELRAALLARFEEIRP